MIYRLRPEAYCLGIKIFATICNSCHGCSDSCKFKEIVKKLFKENNKILREHNKKMKNWMKNKKGDL